MGLAVRVLAAALVAATAVGCTRSERPAGEAGGGAPPRARVVAALGDSITRGAAACGHGGDCVEASWATGTGEDLASHWQRLDGGDGGGSHNLAVSGARVADLASQVRAAAEVGPDYVTVLIGANDACAGTEAGMTPVAVFTAAFRAGLGALVRALPDARILVLSVPDLARVWELGRDRAEVRRLWELYGVCPSMLGDPTDTGADALARRGRVRGRVRAYNAAMAAACAGHAPRCRHDRNAVFDYRFDLEDVSSIDFWHPSRRGQATLARVAWDAGFWP